LNNGLLKTYLTVIDCGSFSAAAKHLGISQPAVTMQIHSLEEELGFSLLDRKYRRITLTEAGHMMKTYAKKALAEEQGVLSDLAALSGEISGTLSIASSTTPGNYLIPGMLGNFLQQYPQVRCRLTISGSQEVAHSVDACEVDLGITGAKIRGYRIDYKACGHDELVPIAPPTFRAKTLTEDLTLEDLCSYPWIKRSGDSGTQQTIRELMLANHVSPEDLNYVVELDNAEAIIGAVEGGLGVAIVSRSAAEKALWLGTVIELSVQSRPWRRRFYLARPRMTLTRAAEAFADYLLKSLE